MRVAEFRILGKSDELLDVIPFTFEQRSVIRNGIIFAEQPHDFRAVARKYNHTHGKTKMLEVLAYAEVV